MTTFTAAVRAAWPGWARLTELQRLTAVPGQAGRLLQALGVPRVQILVDPAGKLAGTETYAAFNPDSWGLWFRADVIAAGITEDEFWRMANIAYHECRHAEQNWRLARKLAGDGWDAARIRAALGVPDPVAAAAVATPLTSGAEYAETADWQYNLLRDGHGVSAASLVNDKKEAAMAAYRKSRDQWRLFERTRDGDPTVAPVNLRNYRDRLAEPGGALALEQIGADLKKDYVRDRELAKQSFLAYARMPVEADAWAVGALVQARAGRAPLTPDTELANLDTDERTMLRIQ
ncbi:hypothetical protein [Actinoplanes sp. G11-F43]|uniref:hypothetical protein n=1 Tax=Actinoplanes sp. G11-F43 TaxID=3424130 RepID=UPI003D33CCBD